MRDNDAEVYKSIQAKLHLSLPPQQMGEDVDSTQTFTLEGRSACMVCQTPQCLVTR